jgi:hypothetical protein
MVLGLVWQGLLCLITSQRSDGSAPTKNGASLGAQPDAT